MAWNFMDLSFRFLEVLKDVLLEAIDLPDPQRLGIRPEVAAFGGAPTRGAFPSS